MFVILAVFFFLLGVIIGSFLNVVILRYNTGRGINGRSGCFSCGKTLVWYELIPVLSFVIQGGKCRTCKAKLSLQYPIVELLTGFTFLGIFLKEGITISTPYFFIIWALLLVIIVYDLRHKIIPDAVVYTFSFLALIRVLVVFFNAKAFASPEFVSALLAGPILFLPFFLLWYFSKGAWIGLGDGKLALGIGWLLGLGLGLSAIVIGFWAGAIVGVGLLVYSRLKLGAKGLTMKSEIPFGPFLILGTAIVFFLSIDVIGIYRIFGL